MEGEDERGVILLSFLENNLVWRVDQNEKNLAQEMWLLKAIRTNITLNSFIITASEGMLVMSDEQREKGS